MTMISFKLLAELHLTIHTMAQEKVFGLTITFPKDVEHLANKPLEELTEDEARELIAAGQRERHAALYPNSACQRGITI